MFVPTDTYIYTVNLMISDLFDYSMKASWIFVLTWGAATANVAHRLPIIFTKCWLQMSAVLRFKWQMPSFIPSMSSFGNTFLITISTIVPKILLTCVRCHLEIVRLKVFQQRQEARN